MRIATCAFLFAVAWCVPAAAQLTVDADTVSLWHLDDGFGITATDDGPAGDDMVFARYPLESPFPAWREHGCFGGAVDFARDAQGSGGYLSDDGSWSFLANEVTIELWVATTTTPYGVLFWAGFIQMRLEFDNDGHPRFYVGNQSNWSDAATSAVAIDDGDWHYVAGTYDGAMVRVYVDGVQRGNAPYSGTLGTMEERYAGGRPQNTFIEGTLDEIRLSDAARSGEEIADTYAALATLCPEPAGSLAAAGVALGLVRRARRRR